MVVRIWWPLGWWFQPFNQQVAYLPQYISLYVLGLSAYRHNWFCELSPRMGRDWLRTTLIAFLLWVVPFLVLSEGGGRVAGAQVDSFLGGFHWQAFVYALWESFMVVGVCLGLLALFRHRWNRHRTAI